MKNYKAENVDEYIAGSAREARRVLEELRGLIKTTVSGVEEGISWGVPWYRYHGMLAGFAAYKNHVSFGPVWMVGLADEDRKLLEKKGYKTGTKTIQIRFEQKIPTTVLKKMLREQVKKNETSS